MKNALPTSYDDLIKHRYGRPAARGSDDPRRRLRTSPYGRAPTGRRRTTPATPASIVLSLSYDRCETLPQRVRGKGTNEYVVQYSIDDGGYEEYVVDQRVVSTASSLDASVSAATEGVTPSLEYRVDVLAPLQSVEDRPQPGALASASSRGSVAADDARAAAAVDRSPSSSEPPGATASADDFIADMQAILSGKKVYDPASGTTLQKDQLNRQQSVNGGGGDRPAADTNAQAIFDRIAQSMEFANSYDLGTVELENRFADFDRLSDIQQRGAPPMTTPGSRSGSGKASDAPAVGSEEFIRDLDAIRQSGLPATAAPTAPQSAAGTASGADVPAPTSSDIEALNLNPAARKAAYALRKKSPAVTFTSGRRTKREQAHAMAASVAQNRKAIEQVYPAGPVRDACQKWIDDHAQTVAPEEIEAGLGHVLDNYADDQLSTLSAHFSGAAFDVQPVDQGAQEITQAIRELEGLETFLEHEDGVATWHAQFK